MSLLKCRLQKLATSIANPICWRGLAHGVAPSVEHLPLLRKIQVDGLIDVGANRGQFTLACRLAKPGTPIAAFEPIPDEAETFRRVHGQCDEVILTQSALGEAKSEAILHLSQSADSSSLLPIGKRQTDLHPSTKEIGTLSVPVNRLDDYRSLWAGRSSQLLKIDVQGFELHVLRGGVATLAECQFVYVECSEVSLYEGQALRSEVSAFLQSHNFSLQDRLNCQFSGKELIQADYLFVRTTDDR